MTQQPVEANVVLTADNSQYDSAMQQSAANTDHFGTSVDSLGMKIDRLAKSAGKKMFAISAADVAGITAATVAYGHFEKQMTSLSAQAAMLNKSMVEQNRTFNTYASAVNKLRGDFGISTSEAAGLVQEITKLNGSTANVDALSKSFAQLAAVTGEAPTQLASSILQFQKTMGGAVRDVPVLNNTLASLASSTNTTVGAIADFSQSIAPMGRMIGMTTNEVAGVSTAFIRAGQDGYTAANAFNKMVGDIAYSTQTGSPDLAKYSNLIGVTVDQFKQMNKTQAVTRIFDELNRQGPAAITTLNRMGLDGMRTMRAITAMSQQTGGIGAAIAEANNADPGTLGRGAAAANDTMAQQLARTRSELTMTGEAMGKNFEPPAKAFLGGIEAASKAIHNLAASPLGKFVAIVMTAIAPVAALAGALLTLSKAALVFSGINSLVRSPLMTGLQAGRTATLSPEYQRISNEGSFVQRSLMAGGARLGGLIGPHGLQYDEAGNPIPRGPSLLNRVTGRGFGGLGLAARFLGYQYNAGQWDPRGRPSWDPRTGMYNPGAPMYDSTSRDRLFSSRTFGEAWQNGGIRGMMVRFGQSFSKDPLTHPKDYAIDENGMVSKTPLGPLTKEAQAAADSMKSVSKESYAFREGLRGFGQGMAGVTRAMTGAIAGMGATGASAVKSLWGAVGGTPLMAGILGYAGFQALRDNTHDIPQSYYGPMNPYLQAGGAGGSAPFTATGSTNRPTPTSPAAARQVSTLDVFTAQAPGRTMTQSAIQGMTPAQALAFLGPQYHQARNNTQSIDAMKLDLISEFGQTQAQSILNNLASGSYGSSGTFMEAAFNSPRQSLLGIPGIRPPSSQDIGKQMDLMLGVDQATVSDVASKYGTKAGFAEQSRQDKNFTGAFASRLRYSTNPNTENIGNYFRRVANFGSDSTGPGNLIAYGFNNLSSQEEAYIKRIQSPQSLGGMGLTTFSNNDYQKMASGLKGAKTAQASFRVLLNQVFSPSTDVSERERKQTLDRYGIATSLWNNPSQAANAIITASRGEFSKQTIDSDPNSLGYRIAHIAGAQTQGGTPLVELGRFQQAIKNPGNLNDQVLAVNKMVDSLQKAGKSAPEIQKIMGNIRAAAGDETDPAYKLASQAQALNYRNFGYQMQNMTPVQQYKAQAQMVQNMQQTAPGDPHQQELLQQAQELQNQNNQNTKSYFLNLIYAQRNFDIQRRRSLMDFGIQQDRMQQQYDLSRSRAEYDFNLQRQYAEQDFQLQRSRAEYDFNLQQSRGTADFYRSLNRSRYDFNLSRMRDEQDYQHQVVLMTKEAAQQQYDIYSRVQVQQTSSSGFLLFNAQDQLKKMRQQKSDLNTLRKEGVSDSVIQQFGLTDTKNAQQLAQMVGDIAQNPKLVQQFNEAVSKRLKAARSLVTDQSSSDWQEFVRQHRLARERAMQDFQRSVTRSLEDFHLQMHRAEADFQTSMNRNEQDFNTQMDRSNKAFKLSMDRAAQDYGIATQQMQDDFGKAMNRSQRDLALMADTINGNLEQVLSKWVDKLSGHAKKQAQVVLQEFTTMGKGTTLLAENTMKNLASVFGVHYQNPKVNLNFNPFFGASSAGYGGRSIPGAADGGVLPGFTPGRDVHHFYSPTGGNLALSGGESIMRPEWTRAIGGEKEVSRQNEMARRGLFTHFAGGGVYRPVATGNLTQGVHDVGTGFPAIDFGVPTGTPVHAVASGRVTTSRDLVNGSGYFSYGRYIQMDHGAFSSLYAHLSQRIAALNDMVAGGHIIGLSGATGNATGPHLHFGTRGISPLNFVGASTAYGKAGSSIGAFLGPFGGAGAQGVNSVLKKEYTQLEDYIASMQGIRPLERGQMSHIINSMARKAFSGLMGTSGATPGAPTNVTGNRKIVKDMAAARGWSGSEWDALYQILMHESGFRNTAQNPNSTAYGMFQFLDDTWGNYDSIKKTSNPRLQTTAGLDYIKGRYGDPIKAWNYWKANGSYGQGAIFSGRKSIDVGESGPEVVLPLNDKGANFIQTILERSSVGNESKSTVTSHYGRPIAHNLYNNYKIDKSTNFTGPITVQALDPNDFMAQLQARQRTKALTQPQMAGSS